MTKSLTIQIIVLSFIQTLLLLLGVYQVQSSQPGIIAAGIFNIAVNAGSLLWNTTWLPRQLQCYICLLLTLCVVAALII